jgi:hypothetical protein
MNKSAARFSQYSALKAAGLFGTVFSSHVQSKVHQNFKSPIAAKYTHELNNLSLEIFGKPCKQLGKKQLERLARNVKAGLVPRGFGIVSAKCLTLPKQSQPVLSEVSANQVEARTNEFAQCSVCGVRLRSARLNRHMRRVHGLDAPPVQAPVVKTPVFKAPVVKARPDLKPTPFVICPVCKEWCLPYLFRDHVCHL